MIARARVEPFSFDLAFDVRSARGRWRRRDGLLLHAEDAAGHHGVGEASPLPGYSPDTLDEARDALQRWCAERGWEGRPMERLASASTPPSARFAIETALLSLEAQRAALPFEAMLSRGPWHDLTTNALLSGPDDLAGADAAMARGLTTLKVKIGVRPFPEELAALERLRAHVGPRVALRLDAGGAWGATDNARVDARGATRVGIGGDVPSTARRKLEMLAEARRRLEALASIAPEFCEEPVSGEALLSLGATATPWAADESLSIPGLAERLLEAPGIRAVVLKPALLGGLFRCLDLARAAHAKGLGLVVTHLHDGPVARSAARALARALPAPPLACGLDEI